jgi:predicted nucleic acid-binding protein
VIYLLDTNAVSDLMRADRAVEDWMNSLGLYAELKVTRQQNGLSLDKNDVWMAATALEIGATLVSRDQDFAEIPELTVVALRCRLYIMRRTQLYLDDKL